MNAAQLYQQQLANYQQLYGMYAGGAQGGSAWPAQQPQAFQQSGQTFDQGYQLGNIAAQQALASQLAQSTATATAAAAAAAGYQQQAPPQPYRSLLSGGTSAGYQPDSQPAAAEPQSTQYGQTNTSGVSPSEAYKAYGAGLSNVVNKDSSPGAQAPVLTSIEQKPPAASYRTGYQQYAAKQTMALPKLSNNNSESANPQPQETPSQEASQRIEPKVPVPQSIQPPPQRVQSSHPQQSRHQQSSWGNWKDNEGDWGDSWDDWSGYEQTEEWKAPEHRSVPPPTRAIKHPVGASVQGIPPPPARQPPAIPSSVKIPGMVPSLKVPIKAKVIPEAVKPPPPSPSPSPDTNTASVKTPQPTTKTPEKSPSKDATAATDSTTKPIEPDTTAKTIVAPPAVKQPPPAIIPKPFEQPSENPYAQAVSAPPKPPAPTPRKVIHPGTLPPHPKDQKRKQKGKKVTPMKETHVPPPRPQPVPLATAPLPVQVPVLQHQQAIESFGAAYRSKQAPPGYKETTFIIHRTKGQKLGMDFDETTVKKTWPHLDAYRCGIRPGMIVASINGVDVWSSAEVKKEFTNASKMKKIRVVAYEKNAPKTVDPEKKYIWLYNVPKSYGISETRAMVEKFGPIHELWKYNTAYIIEYTTRAGAAQALTRLEDIGTLPGGDKPVTVEYKAAPKKQPPTEITPDSPNRTQQKQPRSEEAPASEDKKRAKPDPSQGAVNPYTEESEIPETIGVWMDRGCRDPQGAAQFYANTRARLRECVFLHGIHPKNTSNSGTSTVFMYPLPYYFVPELLNDFILFSSQACGLSAPKMVRMHIYKCKLPINGYQYSMAEIQTEQAREAAQIVGCLDGFRSLIPGLDIDPSSPGLKVTLGQCKHNIITKGNESSRLTPAMMAYQAPLPEGYKKPCRYHCVMGHCFKKECNDDHSQKGDARISKKLVKLSNIPPIWRPKQVQELVEQKWGSEKKANCLWVDILKEESAGFVAVIHCWKASHAKDLIATFSTGVHIASPFSATDFVGNAKPIPEPAEEALVMPLPLPLEQQKLVDQKTINRINTRLVPQQQEPVQAVRPPPINLRSDRAALDAIRLVEDKEKEDLRMQVESLTRANSELWKTSLGLAVVAQQQGGGLARGPNRSLPPSGLLPMTIGGVPPQSKAYPKNSTKRDKPVEQPYTPSLISVPEEKQHARAVPRPEKRPAEPSPAKKVSKPDEDVDVDVVRSEMSELRAKIKKYESVIEISPSLTVENKISELKRKLQSAQERYSSALGNLPKATALAKPVVIKPAAAAKPIAVKPTKPTIIPKAKSIPQAIPAPIPKKVFSKVSRPHGAGIVEGVVDDDDNYNPAPLANDLSSLPQARPVKVFQKLSSQKPQAQPVSANKKPSKSSSDNYSPDEYVPEPVCESDDYKPTGLDQGDDDDDDDYRPGAVF